MAIRMANCDFRKEKFRVSDKKRKIKGGVLCSACDKEIHRRLSHHQKWSVGYDRVKVICESRYFVMFRGIKKGFYH
jgi:hypothetical protein